MTGFFKSIFAPNDGTRRKVKEEVAASRERLETAANRFEETVRQLLERNDQVTGREKHAERD
jgi:hypothetical protein